jgi:hypothetical protein
VTIQEREWAGRALNVRLRNGIGEFAEIFVATSGVLALVIVVMGMATMVRMVRLIYRRE